MKSTAYQNADPGTIAAIQKVAERMESSGKPTQEIITYLERAKRQFEQGEPNVEQIDMMISGLRMGNTAYRNGVQKANDYINSRMQNGPAEDHQKRICIDTVKNPMKGVFMGGPSEAEAIQILKSKFGYTDAMIKKLQGK